MIRIQVFKPFENDEETFQSNKLGDIVTSSEFTIKNSFYGVGNFKLYLSADTNYADKIKEDYWLLVGNDWVTVDDIVDENGTLTITGKELKGILSKRITLYQDENAPAGTEGYDVVQGTTEQVMKHYVTNNVISPSDVNRKIIGVVNASEHTGSEYQNEDTYMSRFENVAELLEKVGKNKEFGWALVPDLTSDNIQFDVIKGANKVESQTERSRVIFAVNRKNISRITRSVGMSTCKNAFYATKSGGTLEADAITQLVTREETAPTGVYRREMQMNVSCDSTTEIETYALKDAENYKRIDSFTVEVAGNDFGTVYNLGDYVTIKNNTETCDTQITVAERTYKNSSSQLKLTFGNEKPKPVDKINQQLKNKL